MNEIGKEKRKRQVSKPHLTLELLYSTLLIRVLLAKLSKVQVLRSLLFPRYNYAQTSLK